MERFQRDKPLFSERPKYKSIGLARVSTSSQSVDAQVIALKEEGCVVVFEEKISTRFRNSDRPQLQSALSALEEGDELVITKLDRLGRSQVEVINRLNDLQQQGIHVKTLDGLIDTQALGKMAPLVIGLLTGLAECERSMIVERTRESIEHRRRTGGNLGGRPGLPQIKKDHIIRLREEGNSLRQIVSLTGVSLAAVQKTCKEHQAVAA